MCVYVFICLRFQLHLVLTTVHVASLLIFLNLFYYIFLWRKMLWSKASYVTLQRWCSYSRKLQTHLLFSVYFSYWSKYNYSCYLPSVRSDLLVIICVNEQDQTLISQNFDRKYAVISIQAKTTNFRTIYTSATNLTTEVNL